MPRKTELFGLQTPYNPLYCKPSNSRFPEETTFEWPQDPDITDQFQDKENVRDTCAENADQLDSHEEDVAYELNVENSGEELNLENPEQDDELQVVDDIDVIEQ